MSDAMPPESGIFLFGPRHLVGAVAMGLASWWAADAISLIATRPHSVLTWWFTTPPWLDLIRMSSAAVVPAAYLAAVRGKTDARLAGVAVFLATSGLVHWAIYRPSLTRHVLADLWIR